MPNERYLNVFPTGDGRWVHQLMVDGQPFGPRSAAYDDAAHAAAAAVHLYPEDEIRIEERHG